MEADSPSPLHPSLQENLKERPINDLEEQPPPPEDSWFDEQSDKDDKDEIEEEPSAVQLSIPVGQPAEKIKEFEYNEYSKFDHQVDYKHLVLMIVLSGHRMIDLKKISGLKEGYIEMVSNKSKLILKTITEEAAGEAIQRVSDFIDTLSVLKLGLKGQTAIKYSNFAQLKNYLRKDGVVMFGTNFRQIHELFIGGVMKPSELRVFQERLRSFRVSSMFLRSIRNTRSYKLIVSAILNLECTRKALITFNQVKMAEVERRNRSRQIRVILGAISGKDFTPNDYEDVVMRQIRKCCAVAFCFTSKQRFIEKPKVQGVTFQIINERSVGKSYLYVIAGKDVWWLRKEEIKAEIGKLENVIGVRFFYHIFPHFYNFHFDKQRYYYFKYPQNKPYSVSVSAKTKQGFSFNWQAFLDGLLQVCQGQEAFTLIV